MSCPVRVLETRRLIGGVGRSQEGGLGGGGFSEMGMVRERGRERRVGWCWVGRDCQRVWGLRQAGSSGRGDGGLVHGRVEGRDTGIGRACGRFLCDDGIGRPGVAGRRCLRSVPHGTGKRAIAKRPAGADGSWRLGCWWSGRRSSP